jgi:hypothetical protein
VLAAETLPLRMNLVTCGIATAERIPNITITISNSMRIAYAQ